MFNGTHGMGLTKRLWAAADDETKEITKAFFKEMKFSYVDSKNNCYVHGGFDRMEPLERQDEYSFCWDRSLWSQAKSVRGEGAKLKTVDDFNKIFIGHTPTAIDKDLHGVPITAPQHFGGVWNLDTGAGFMPGKLTLMNVETYEYVQSDFMYTLYPDANLW